MDTTTLIRIIAGVLAVAVAAFVVYRRKNAKANRVTSGRPGKRFQEHLFIDGVMNLGG